MVLFWYWWILAVVLITLEAVVPGVSLLWFGLSAAIVGLIAMLAPDLGWQIEGLVFAVLALVMVIATRRLAKRSSGDSSVTRSLNNRAENLVGQRLRLEGPITNGRGRATVGDGQWMVVGPDLPAGSTVRVTGIDGTFLKVEAVESATPKSDAPDSGAG